MLEIYQKFVQEIAKMPTNHSWAVKLMELPEEKADKAESMVLDWIEKTVTKMYPKSLQAERIVRTTWLHMLEAEAIEMWVKQNPKGEWIPIIPGPKQAVRYAMGDLLYPDPVSEEAAEEFLTLMQEGKMKPDVEKILQTINESNLYVSQEELKLAQNFIETIKEHDFNLSTDICDILVLLDQLSIRFGYTIGCYLSDFDIGSSYELYPHKINANLEFKPEYEYENKYRPRKDGRKVALTWKVVSPFQYNPDQIIIGKQIGSLSRYLPSIFQYIHVPFTQEGIWQLYLLSVATDYFPLGWHANYKKSIRIFSLDDFNQITAIDCESYKNDSMLPSINFINSERAVVECTYFNMWSGLCRESVYFDKSKGYFEKSEVECHVLIKYDCGMRY